MSKALRYIMLVDDNPADNFFHEREIKKIDPTFTIITKNTGREALDYLRGIKDEEEPDPIFLDINMPGMNGWEFLEEYGHLDQKIRSKAIIIMLTTSENPDDEARARTLGLISDYISKPLTKEKMKVIVDKYFK